MSVLSVYLGSGGSVTLRVECPEKHVKMCVYVCVVSHKSVSESVQLDVYTLSA